MGLKGPTDTKLPVSSLRVVYKSVVLKSFVLRGEGGPESLF